MTKLPEGKSRLDLVRQGLAQKDVPQRGRLLVSLDKLREDPCNERKTFRNMEGLIASIRAAGLIEPLTVMAQESGGYQIITGHRRYRAAKAAGLSTVEVLIREPENALRRRQKSIISNVQREDIGPVELSEALQGLLDEDPNLSTQEQLAKLIGKDKAWVSGMLRILSLPEAIRQKVGCTQQSLSYDSMIRIARLDEPALQAKLVDALLSGASQAEIRQKIYQHKGGTGGGATKPKRAFHTRQQAVVIVQAIGPVLTPEQCVAALRKALTIARGDENELAS